MEQALPEFTEKISTGNEGLDEVLSGGLPIRHLYLVEGDSGTGKTTLGMQFLLQGVREGQKSLLITLAEAAADLHEIALSHGWSLEGLHIYELPPRQRAQLEEQQTIFHTAEVELGEAIDQIIDVLRRERPQRVVFDSLSELRFLASGPVRFRFQMLALSQVLADIQATVILVDRVAPATSDRVLDSLVHGIIQLQQSAREYGGVWRRLLVRKLRGARYESGWHDFLIDTGGLRIFPRLRGVEEVVRQEWQQLATGLDGLDALVGGGLEFGTACLIGGAAGTGKSSITSLFMHAALQEGIPSAAMLFDERPETLFKRTQDMNMALRPFVEQGLLTVEQTVVGESSAGKFAHTVRLLVEEKGVRFLVIDSLSGYLRAMPEEHFLLNQVHDLLNYLSRKNVLSMLVITHHGMLGETTPLGVDLSYLADTVIVIRHFEARGVLRHAISVVKKRHGEHERTIRELSLVQGGLSVGEPLQAFRGVLTGNPDFVGNADSLLTRGKDR